VLLAALPSLSRVYHVGLEGSLREKGVRLFHIHQQPLGNNLSDDFLREFAAALPTSNLISYLSFYGKRFMPIHVILPFMEPFYRKPIDQRQRRLCGLHSQALRESQGSIF
jgi:hypothetical protein